MIGRVDPGQVLAVLSPSMVALSVYLCGKRPIVAKRLARGWLIGLLVQIVNAVYALVTAHWGWLLGLLLVAPVFAKNWLTWRKEDRQTAAAESYGHQRLTGDAPAAATEGGAP